jgi:EmrB/QacA subfamily drug resistance transporter
MATHVLTTAGGGPTTGPAARRWWALAVLCLSLVIVSLDNTIVSVALPTLVRELSATSTQLQWVVDAYALAFGGLMLVAGSVADRLGHKRLLLTGLGLFAAASGWAAMSGSVEMLIAARAAMGVGGAMMMPATLAIIVHTFADPAERSRAIGVWAGSNGLGIAIGPIAGGTLLDHFWWGSIFFVNVPIIIFAIACVIPLVAHSRDEHAAAPDPIGGLLSVAGVGLLLWGIIEAPARGWGSAVVLGAGSSGVAVLALFVGWELHTSHPMLNLSFFRRRSFSMATTSVGLTMFGMFGSMFLLTQYLQFDLAYSALQTGVRILPVAGLLAVTAPISARLAGRIGTKLTVAPGIAAAAAGLWQLSTTTTAGGYPGALPGMCLLGIGAGMVLPAAIDSITGTLPPRKIGIGSATNGVFLQVGGALGVAIMGSLLSTRYQDRLADGLAGHTVPPAALSTMRGSLGGALEVAARAGAQGRPLAALARSSFIDGLQLGFGAGALVVGAACLLALAALPLRPWRFPGQRTSSATG